MKAFDEFYFGKYSNFIKHNDKSFSSFYAAILSFGTIGLVIMPAIVFIYNFVDNFVYNINSIIDTFYILFCVISYFFYCWYYFAYKKNSNRIIEKYDVLNEDAKKKMRRKTGKLTLLCYSIAVFLMIAVGILYTNWSFEKLGKKPWYEKVNYYDNSKK